MTIGNLNKHNAAMQKANALILPEEIHYNVQTGYFGNFTEAEACRILHSWSGTLTYENVTLVAVGFDGNERARFINGAGLAL